MQATASLIKTFQRGLETQVAELERLPSSAAPLALPKGATDWPSVRLHLKATFGPSVDEDHRKVFGGPGGTTTSIAALGRVVQAGMLEPEERDEVFQWQRRLAAAIDIALTRALGAEEESKDSLVGGTAMEGSVSISSSPSADAEVEVPPSPTTADGVAPADDDKEDLRRRIERSEAPFHAPKPKVEVEDAIMPESESKDGDVPIPLVPAPVDPTAPLVRPAGATVLDISTWNQLKTPYPSTPGAVPEFKVLTGLRSQAGAKLKLSGVIGREVDSGCMALFPNSMGYLCLQDGHFHPRNLGDLITFWDHEGLFPTIRLRMVDLPGMPPSIRVLYRKNSRPNEWFYAGNYVIAWEGEMLPGELLALNNYPNDSDVVRDWTRVLRDRSIPAKMFDLEAFGFTRPEKGNSDIPTLFDQAKMNPNIHLKYLVLRCVGFDQDALRKWTDRREANEASVAEQLRTGISNHPDEAVREAFAAAKEGNAGRLKAKRKGIRGEGNERKKAKAAES